MFHDFVSYSSDENMPLRQSTAFTKEETLLILRAYQQHPSKWNEIVEEVKGNANILNREQKHLYETGSSKKLKDRCSHKLAKLLKSNAEKVTDPDIQ